MSLQYITRKSLLYKTGVEYGDYCINHVQGCSHGCLYPCYAMMLAKRFGTIKSYEEWTKPKIVQNAMALLQKELPKYQDKIESVHFSFTTDPFMYGFKEIGDLTLSLVSALNQKDIKCTMLTKGVLPIELAELSNQNEVGITLISLSEEFREKYEPFAAPYRKRIESIRELHNKGLKTWVSIEPYPTPNIIDQDFKAILNSISFVDKIIFGKLNYNPLVSQYVDRLNYYNDLSNLVIDFCQEHGIDYHIKQGTMTESRKVI